MFKPQNIPLTNQPAPNSVAEFSSFHLSYNARTTDYGSKTTALVLKNTVFLILRGDHRAEMNKRAEDGGLQSCFDYYVENIEMALGLGDLKTVVHGCKTLGYIQDAARQALGDQGLEKLQAAYRNASAAP